MKQPNNLYVTLPWFYQLKFITNHGIEYYSSQNIEDIMLEVRKYFHDDDILELQLSLEYDDE